MSDTPRRTLRQWLRRAPAQPRPSAPPAPGPRPPMGPPPATPHALASPAEAWPLICEQVALRVLAAAYQMAEQVERAEAEEHDPARLDQLYRIDHGLTRIRRQAEIMQVLTGRPVDDARRQITTLLDVVRAATSAIEHYPRVDVRYTVDLAIVDFAADDLIRMLTELLDNATRFSPPGDAVTVSAHLTEAGSILIRVEDNGVGMPTDRLTALNGLLSGDRMPVLGLAGELRLGLHVVARLAEAHRMRATLLTRPGGGTTATVLVPAQLVCETPHDARRTAPHPPAGTAPAADAFAAEAWSPTAMPSRAAAAAGARPPRQAEPAASDDRSLSGRWANRAGTRSSTPVADHGGWSAPDSGPDSEVVELPDWRGDGGLPRRVTMSVRGDDPIPSDPGPAAPGTSSWADDVANFAAGFADGLSADLPESPAAGRSRANGDARSTTDTGHRAPAHDSDERPVAASRGRRTRKADTATDSAQATGSAEETA